MELFRTKNGKKVIDWRARWLRGTSLVYKTLLTEEEKRILKIYFLKTLSNMFEND